MRSLQPKVAAIAMQRRGRGWQALPNIIDGHETYELVLTVAHDARAMAGQQRQHENAVSTRTHKWIQRR